jgi:hypothetical protein
MEVSMDGLRRQLLRNYNSLTEKLNSRITDASWDPQIIIDPDYIQREMDGLRSCIVTLAFTYMDGESGWKEMDENTHFEEFNPESFENPEENEE